MRLTWTYTLCAVLVSAACADVTGPKLLDDDVSASRPFLYGASTGYGYAQDSLATDQVPDDMVAYQSSAPKLESYHASFTAVQGEETVFRLHYQNAADQSPFLSVVIPKTARMMDGAGVPLTDGDTVVIDVTVDRTCFHVHIEAPGVSRVDGSPMKIVLDMTHADLGDRFLSQVTTLARPSGEQWGAVQHGVTIGRVHIEIETELFSNYAVAW